MSINVGEVTIEATREASPPPAPGGGSASARPDPHEIRLILRRDDDRRQRLWVD